MAIPFHLASSMLRTRQHSRKSPAMKHCARSQGKGTQRIIVKGGRVTNLELHTVLCCESSVAVLLQRCFLLRCSVQNTSCRCP